MKKFFKYPFDESVRTRLISYYENTSLGQHDAQHKLKARLKLDRIRQMVKFASTDHVLDLGCSRGEILRLLAEEIRSGHGVDISKSVIEENNRLNDSPKLAFHHYDGQVLPLPDQYDKIMLLDILEHAFEPDQVMSLVRGALKPSGQLVIQVPFTGWLSELVFGAYHQGHLRYYDPAYLRAYLQRMGFEVTQMRWDNSVPFSVFFLKYPLVWKLQDGLVRMLPAAIYPYFGEIIAVARLR